MFSFLLQEENSAPSTNHVTTIATHFPTHGVWINRAIYCVNFSRQMNFKKLSRPAKC